MDKRTPMEKQIADDLAETYYGKYGHLGEEPEDGRHMDDSPDLLPDPDNIFPW